MQGDAVSGRARSVKHGARRGQPSTMGEQVRRQREVRRREREGWRSAWRTVLLGKPMAAATTPEVRPGPPPTLLARVAVSWPRQVPPRQLEQRWSYAPSVSLFRALLLAVALVLGSLISGVGMLAALAIGHPADDGLTAGLLLSCLLMVAAAAYFSWGGFLDWSNRRRRAR